MSSSSSSGGGGGEQARRPRPRRRPVQILEFLLRDEHRMSRPKRYREQIEPLNQKFYSWKKKTKQDFCSRCNWLLRSLQHMERLELYSFYGNWKFRIVKVRVQEEQENNAASSSEEEEEQQLGELENNAASSSEEEEEQQLGERENNAASSENEEEQQLGEPENNASFEGNNPWFEYEDEHSEEEEEGGDQQNPEIAVSEREEREQRSEEPQNNAATEEEAEQQRENNASTEEEEQRLENNTAAEDEEEQRRLGEPQNNAATEEEEEQRRVNNAATEEEEEQQRENNAPFEGDNQWFEGGYGENFEEEECEDEHDTANSEEERGDEHNSEVRYQVRHGSGSQSNDEYLRLSSQLRKAENAIKRRKRMIAMTRKKAFADIGDFAILAKFSVLFRLILLELPIQRYPLVLAQFEERINREMRESLGKNVLKHNVPTSVVSALLGSHFEEMVEGFKLKIEAGICYISVDHGRVSEQTGKFKYLEELIAELDSFQLQKEELDRKLEAMRSR